MKSLRHLSFIVALLASSAAIAADNATLITPCASGCVTMRAKDVGSGVQSMIQILGDTSGNPIYGTAGTANANVLTVQGVASMTPLLVTLSGTNTTTVTQATAANLNATVVGTGTFATQSAITAASGSIASGALAAGSMVDLLTMRGTKNAGTAAANSLQVGGVFNSTPLTLTDTQQSSAQLDANGYLKVNVAAGGASGGTSSTYGAAFPATGTAIGYTDGTNMVAARVGAVANVAAATNFVNSLSVGQYNATPLTVTDTRYQSLQLDVNGYLKTNVTNTNANGSATSANSSPVVIASDQVAVAIKAASGVFASGSFASGSHASGSFASGAFASGSIGSGAVASGAYASGSIASGAMVDLGAQADSACSTDNGTCSAIALVKRTNQRLTTINSSIGAANAYETVAASQTAQAMGATGATGDYLSHCVVTPGTTSPGVVTILDNATAVVSFAGGASSVSNLVSFPIPIGAVSVSGAWKITTGANVTVVCVGRFT